MGTENQDREVAGTRPVAVKGTENLGYWEFKKEFCEREGWDLRRIEPQTYEVLNSKREKIGIFKSEEGYFPRPAAVKGTEDLGYWDFRKEFCKREGWDLRRIKPQTYEVLNSKREKIGIFKSKEGYFPHL